MMLSGVFVPQSSEDITVEWIQNEVLKAHIQEPFEVVQKRLRDDTDQENRQGYMSWSFKLETQVRIISAERILKYNLYVKMFPLNEYHRGLIRKLRSFEREVHVFSTLLDQIRDVQKRRGQTRILEPFWPKIYHVCEDTNFKIAALVMEDLSTQGYELVDKKKYFDYEHLLLVVKALARSHALVYNVKSKMGVEEMLLSNRRILDNPFYDSFWFLFDSNYDWALNVLRQTGEEGLAKRLEIFREKCGTPSGYMEALIQQPHRLRIFGHGDIWVNNLLFRHEERQGRNVPVDVKLIDLQMSRYSHPCVDLAFFLFSSSSSQMRKAKLTDLLRAYYETFFRILRQLGTSLTMSDYTFEEFLDDFENFRELGLINGMFFIRLQMDEATDIPVLDKLESDGFEEIRAWLERGKEITASKEAAERLIDLVQECAEYEII